jgi:MFS family permease
MPEELSLTPTADAVPPRSSLWRRLFSLHSIGFYLMILLALIGAAYTFTNADDSRWYWQRLIPVTFGLICIMIQWRDVEPNLKARTLLIARQILHWTGVLLTMHLAFLASGSSLTDALDDRQVSFLLMLTVTLGTFLAGVYLDWRLCLVAVVLAASAMGMVILQNLAPMLVLVGVGVAVIYFVWIWWYGRWQTRRADQGGT